jgi:hypothetical protein
MPAKTKIKPIASPYQSEALWTIHTLKVKAGDTVRWETYGEAMILFFPYRDIFEELTNAADDRVIEIGKKQKQLELKVRADACPNGKARDFSYAIFHLPKIKNALTMPRGKPIVKR